jgi:hypothetical protein
VIVLVSSDVPVTVLVIGWQHGKEGDRLEGLGDPGRPAS